jgi:hypothetical protein
MVPLSSWAAAALREPRPASARGQTTGSAALCGNALRWAARRPGVRAAIPGQNPARRPSLHYCVHGGPVFRSAMYAMIRSRPGTGVYRSKTGTGGARASAYPGVSRVAPALDAPSPPRKAHQSQTTCGIDLVSGINPRVRGEILHGEVIPHANSGSGRSSWTGPASAEAVGTDGPHAHAHAHALSAAAVTRAAPTAQARAATITTECAG